MTLARDGSSPVSNATDDPGTQVATQVSKTFSPPAGSVIIVNAVALSSGVADWSATPFAITDSLGSHLSWNLKADRYDNSDSQYSERIAVFWAYCPSAQTNMTVSVTVGANDPSQYIFGIDVKPDVWAGANTSGPIGAVISGTAASASTLSEAITPTAVGSALMLYGGPTFDGTANPTAGSGCYGVNPGSSAVYFLGEWHGTSGGPTLTPSTSPVTMAMTFTGPQTWQYVGYEVLAAAGAVTAAGTLSISGTAAAQAPATAAGTVALAGTAAGKAPAAASGSVAVAGAAAGRAPVTAAGALAVSGSAAATAPAGAAGSAALAGSASATGPGVNAAGALAVTGTAAGAAPASAAGIVTVAGAAAAAAPAPAAGSLALTGTASAAAPAPAAAALVLSGTATPGTPAAPAGTMVLSGAATATAPAAAAGSAAISGTAAASGPGNTASGTLALAGTATARAPAAASAALTLAGAAAAGAATGAAAGTITLTGTAQFLAPFTVGTLTASDTRTGGPS